MPSRGRKQCCEAADKLVGVAQQENAMDNRMQLYSHIVLSGGCTMIPGLPARLEKDLRRMYLDQILQVGSQ